MSKTKILYRPNKTNDVNKQTLKEVWRQYDADEIRLTAPLSARMIELAEIGIGSKVLDLATGRGEPAIPTASCVAPNGIVIGVDTDESMLRMARERADAEGIVNLDLLVASAASLDSIHDNFFDAVLSRWGLMYMEKPSDALLAARKSLVPDGVLVASVWVEPDLASFYSFPRDVLEEIVTVPSIDLSLPGVFYYADFGRLRSDLETAGFTIKHTEEFEISVMEADSPAGVVAWTKAFGMSKLLTGFSLDIQQRWEASMLAKMATYRQEKGYRLGGITRIVVASR